MIGVFDSGVGGLSVWKELVALMPNQEYIYVSDSGYCPYGPRPKSYITERAARISEFLISRGADIIVVACNTATAAAIKHLRSSYEIPFVGMEPAVKPAVLQSKSGVIGVLATQGTFKGELYLGTLHKFASNSKVIEQIGTGLVEIVESGKVETEEADRLLKNYLQPMVEAGADHIVLGCTHYPFLAANIERITGGTLEIVNPAPAIARQTEHLLAEIGKNTLPSSVENGEKRKNLFYTTGNNLELLKSMVFKILDDQGLGGEFTNEFQFLGNV